jgi:hypothetical protein
MWISLALTRPPCLPCQVEVDQQQAEGEAQDTPPVTSPRTKMVHLRLKRALSGSVARVDPALPGTAGGNQRLSPAPVLARTVSAPPQASALTGFGLNASADPTAHADMCSPRTRGRWWFAKQRRTIVEFSSVDLECASGSKQRVRACAAFWCLCALHVCPPGTLLPSLMGCEAREGGLVRAVNSRSSAVTPCAIWSTGPGRRGRQGFLGQ